MKIIMEQSADCEQPEIKVRYSRMDWRLQRLMEQVRLYSSSFAVEWEGVTKYIPLEDIYYFDTVDNRTFLYLKEQVYPCPLKLYEIEDRLQETPFVRISKSCILNADAVVSVRAQLSGRMEAVLGNGEKVIISKHYIREFRGKIEQEVDK